MSLHLNQFESVFIFSESAMSHRSVFQNEDKDDEEEDDQRNWEE